MNFALSAYSLGMTHPRRITAVGVGTLLLSASLTACGSDPPAKDGPSAGAITIGDANTFQSTATLTPGDAVMLASSGSVCWNTQPQDLLCHDADPIKTLFLFRIARSREETLDLLVRGELTDYVDATLRYNNADADPDKCATIAEFQSGDAPIANIDAEYFADPSLSYLLVFSSATAVKQGTLSMKFLDPVSGTGPVEAPTGCQQLEYTVELETLTPVTVPKTGPWPVDWRGLTRTGDGNPEVPFADIDRALLAFYPGRSLQDLEMNIFDLEQLEGAKYWEIPLTGERNTDLSLAIEQGSTAAFPGFDAAAAGVTGTWMLALTCSTCGSPAPIMLTVLNPT